MTPLFQRLNFKGQTEILAVHAPQSFEGELAEMSQLANVYRNEDELENILFAIVFVTKQQEIDELIQQLFPKLYGDAVLWFCYPKGTSKNYQCGFNKDTCWSAVRKNHLVRVRQVAIDSDWTALRFRKAEFIKKLTRKRDF